MERHVDIAFDCLPLRSINRFDAPLDASPELEAFCERVKTAAGRHGLHNSYYLYRGKCVFRLTNDATVGVIGFRFEGTVLTDPNDQKISGSELVFTLAEEACDWLTASAVEWLSETARNAVEIEFNQFIAAGDLAKTLERLAKLQAQMQDGGGFIGLGL